MFDAKTLLQNETQQKETHKEELNVWERRIATDLRGSGLLRLSTVHMPAVRYMRQFASYLRPKSFFEFEFALVTIVREMKRLIIQAAIQSHLFLSKGGD